MTKLQRRYVDQTAASKSFLDCRQQFFQRQHQQQYQYQKVLSWHLHGPGSHQSSLNNIT